MLLQLQVTNSPFSQEQVDLLNQLFPTLTDYQRIWITGYLSIAQASGAQIASSPQLAPLQATVESQAGQSAQAAPTAQAVLAAEAPAVQAAAIPKDVTILFGSQTGNCQRLAKSLSSKLQDKGFDVTLSAMRDYKTNSLKKVSSLLIIASTHGEGDPPDNAISFYEFLHSKRAPQLEGVKYSVLALGDTSYEFFCKTGKDFDKRLEELGGTRITNRIDCDLDFDEPAAEWFNAVIQSLSVDHAPAGSTGGLEAAPINQAVEASTYSRTNPFRAEVIENINLNGRGSHQETRHLVLSLEGSNLQFKPGDCLGILPENNPELVHSIIAASGWNPIEPIVVNKQGEKRPLKDALRENFEITVLTKPLLEQAAELSNNEALRELVKPGNEQQLKSYLEGRDLLDLVKDFGPWKVISSKFVTILRKLPTRLYSIASSFEANPDEVHLTIRAVRYEAHNRQRYGVASVQVADRLQPGDTVQVYVHENENFRLPEDSSKPIIMIGPGTGVAPFRAFMQEREETEAEGKSWLFFGDRHFLTDFLYQTEWQRWMKDGVLTRMDVAFSRDTDQKVYVQHRMQEKSSELYAWLQEGATVYVCGDEKHMAHDVHKTLLAILEKEGGLNATEAESYLASLQEQKRYQRDVY
jgi:sulfite reductase (NADPH) flavoprotein alpha-component